MKVFIIGPAFPLRGGIANFNEALCRSMRREGINASVISFSLQYPSFLFPGKTQYDNGLPPENVPVNTMINSVNPANWFRVARYIVSENPDLVIIRFWIPFMGPCLGTIARLIRKKIKIIAITDNVIPHEKKPGDKMFTKYFTGGCDAFIAMSASVLSDLQKFDNQKPKKYLPHPVYDIFGKKVDKKAAFQQLKLDDGYQYVLFFGIIRKYKGLDILFEAFSKFAYREYKVKLLVAGEFYEDEKQYHTLIENLGIADGVLMHTGFVASEQVKYYFSAASIVAQTYRSATQSGVAQVAYHFETPLLVTDVGGLAEIVPDKRAGYVTPADPIAIAAALNDFFAHNREAGFTLCVKEEKQKFSWEYFIRGIYELSDQIQARNL